MHSSSTKENQAAQPSTSGQMSSRSKRELIECPICTATVKHPKLLPCGHSLCGPQSEEKCLLKWEKCQEISGEIKCPICQKVYQMEASDALTPYGFKEVLEGIESMRVCERHNVEIKFYCNEDNEEICDLCWKEGHLKHDIDLIEVAKCNKLSPKWERRQLEDLRKLCLEAAEAFGEGADFLLGKQERYNRIADMCLSLQQKQRQIDEKFQRKDFDHDDEDIAEFEQYIEYIEKEAEKLAADLAKLDELSAELKRVTAKTAKKPKIPIYVGRDADGEITNHMVMAKTKTEEKQASEGQKSPKKKNSTEKKNRRDTTITNAEITPKNRQCLRGLDGKYGRWDEILRDILNGKLKIVQNRKTSMSETDDEDDDDDEDMPEETGNRNYDTSERDGRYEPIRTNPEANVIQIHTDGEIPQGSNWIIRKGTPQPTTTIKPGDFMPDETICPGTPAFS